MVKERFNCNGVPIQLPIGRENEFKGMVDLINNNAIVYYDDMGRDVRIEEIPEDMKELAEKYRSELIESVAELDEELMMKYFEGEELTVDEIKSVIRKATLSNDIVPICCGTSYRNKGVQPLLDAIVDFMPAPTDIEAIKGVNPDTEEEEVRHASDEEPFSALAFKIATDPYVGKLCFFRVYSGTVDAGTTVYNSVKDNRERLGRILQMHANHREDIDTVYAGDIAAGKGTDTLSLVPEKETSALVPSKVTPASVLFEIVEGSVPKNIVAPVKKGDVLGKAKVYYAGQELAEINLVAGEDVSRSTVGLIMSHIKNIVGSKVFLIISGVAFFLCALYLAYMIYGAIQDKKNPKNGARHAKPQPKKRPANTKNAPKKK